MPDPQMLERKLSEMLLDGNHVALILGILAIIVMLRKAGPLTLFLFGTEEQPSKWKCLITPLNLALSAIGVFAMGLTSEAVKASGTGMKFIVVVVITAVTILIYEAAIKYVVRFIQKKFGNGG